MKARLIDLSFGFNTGKQRLTVELDGDFRSDFDELKDEPVNITIKKYRQRRSLDANAYAWVLMDKIAEKMSLPKTEIYRRAIKNIGGVSDTVCVVENAADKLCMAWERNGTGWQTERLTSKVEGCVNVVLYYGSSTYDTKQMSTLIDYIVQDAQSLGINTDTPEQIERYKEQWKT